MRSLKIIILGSGTSTGVPLIGCPCAVCTSDHPKNKRLRSSIAMTQDDKRHMLVDLTPDLRQQVLREKITDVSNVFLTHTHADHCHGFDDLRQFYFIHQKAVPLYAAEEHAKEIRARFSYAFEPTGYLGTKPQVDLRAVDDQIFRIDGIDIERVSLPHGDGQTSAFRFGNFAYATDFKSIPEQIISRWLGKIHTMVASGLRFREHPTHSSIPETIELFSKLEVERGVITHLAHDVDLSINIKDLPPNISFAYDGMVIDVPM